MRRLSVGLIAGLVGLALLVSESEAWDWLNAPFDLRLGLALDRGSTFTDVVGLSASAAYPYGSSVNPGNDDFLRAPPNDFKLAVTGTGLYVPFETGAYTTAGAGSVAYRFDSAGTVTAIYSKNGSHDAHSTQGDNYRLDSQDFTIRYGKLAAPWLGLGGEFKYTDSTLLFEPGSQDFPVHTKTNSTGYDFRLGGLVAPSREWLFALTGGAGWSYAKTRGQIAIPEIFGGPEPISFNTFTKSINLRTGVGWRPSDKFGAYLDWEYYRLWNKESVSVGRAFAGAEFMPVVWLALRAGGSVDTVGKTTASAGIGFYGSKHVMLELAYVYNAFPEIRREFGVAHLISTSVVFVY
jgi:hypothetical protein